MGPEFALNADLRAPLRFLGSWHWLKSGRLKTVLRSIAREGRRNRLKPDFRPSMGGFVGT